MKRFCFFFFEIESSLICLPSFLQGLAGVQ